MGLSCHRDFRAGRSIPAHLHHPKMSLISLLQSMCSLNEQQESLSARDTSFSPVCCLVAVPSALPRVLWSPRLCPSSTASVSHAAALQPAGRLPTPTHQARRRCGTAEHRVSRRCPSLGSSFQAEHLVTFSSRWRATAHSSCDQDSLPSSRLPACSTPTPYCITLWPFS